MNNVEQITIDDVKPFIDQAKEFGLKHIYFTGGEPFINKHILKILEYALKHGADGVMVTGCRHNDCYFRFGNGWTQMRFAAERKPILRGRADRNRIRVHGAAETDKPEVEKDLADFRRKLVELNRASAGAADESKRDLPA